MTVLDEKGTVADAVGWVKLETEHPIVDLIARVRDAAADARDRAFFDGKDWPYK